MLPVHPRGYHGAPLAAIAAGAQGHRYWRIANIHCPGTNLELSELQLFENGVNVNGSATKTASNAVNDPATRPLTNLFDGNLTTRTDWAQATVNNNSFFIKWDFGAGNAKNITGVKQGGFDTNTRYMQSFAIQWSDDDSAWTTAGFFSALAYPGNNTLSSEYSVNAGAYPSRIFASLLHFNGTDGATTFTDVTGKTWTARGNAQIDTAQSKFGGASGLFDGSGDWIDTPNTADHDFGDGPFTIEGFVRFDSPATNGSFVAKDGTTTTRCWAFIWNKDESPGNNIEFNFWDVGGTERRLRVPWIPSANTWYHVVVQRRGNTIEIAIDGAFQATTFNATGFSIRASSRITTIGIHGNSASYPLDGWLDEWRITKGQAVYAGDFTPPAAPFADA